jgi:hypothetical protein
MPDPTPVGASTDDSNTEAPTVGGQPKETPCPAPANALTASATALTAASRAGAATDPEATAARAEAATPATDATAARTDLAAEIREWLNQGWRHEISCGGFRLGVLSGAEPPCNCHLGDAVRALRAVLEEHRPAYESDRHNQQVCECTDLYPCPTVRAIHTALIGGEG